MRNKSVVWIPVLLVGAMVYWTLALGFGGLSLVSLTGEFPLSDPDERSRDAYQSITVNLTESSDQQAMQEAILDAQAQSGGLTVDLLPESDARVPRAGEQHGGPGLSGGSLRSGPGDTAF